MTETPHSSLMWPTSEPHAAFSSNTPYFQTAAAPSRREHTNFIFASPCFTFHLCLHSFLLFWGQRRGTRRGLEGVLITTSSTFPRKRRQDATSLYGGGRGGRGGGCGGNSLWVINMHANNKGLVLQSALKTDLNGRRGKFQVAWGCRSQALAGFGLINLNSGALTTY